MFTPIHPHPKEIQEQKGETWVIQEKKRVIGRKVGGNTMEEKVNMNESKQFKIICKQ